MNRQFGEADKCRLDSIIRNTRASLGEPERIAYDSMLAFVFARSRLLSRRSPRGIEAHTALVAFALHCDHWIRPLETWVPRGVSWWEQIASLAEHLFVRFSVPKVFLSAWFEGELGRRVPQHDWYIRIGRGESVRRCGIPVHVTRAMALRLASAPQHLTVTAALRWAFLDTLSLSPALTAAVLETRLGRELDDDPFWRTVLVFFARSDVSPEQIGPIVDYVYARKFATREGFTEEGNFGILPAPEPDFEMKGRALTALLRRVDQWHVEVGRCTFVDSSWEASGFSELRLVKRVPRVPSDRFERGEGRDADDVRIWTINEILTSRALAAEGRAMRHCVATYIDSCRKQRTSIWSMRLETREKQRRVLTIEVDLATRRVRQARRACNGLPSEAERALVVEWATREGLHVPAGARL